MSVPAAYIAVVLIWSTTPLGIKFSTETVSPLLAVTLRMVGGAVLAWAVLMLWRKPFPLNRAALHSYLAGSLGVFGAMTLVYFAAESVPSGLISVFFGTTPIIAGLFAGPLLGERTMTPTRFVALLISVAGLVVIFGAGDVGTVSGLALLAGSVVLFAISGIWVKKLAVPLHPLAQTTGTLVMSGVAYIVVCVLLGETWPTAISDKSAGAIAYLAVAGSVVAFGAYFYVLERLSVVTVSLIPIITPVLALLLGAWLADEQVGLNVIVGTAAILAGLALYQLGGLLPDRMTKRRKKFLIIDKI